MPCASDASVGYHYQYRRKGRQFRAEAVPRVWRVDSKQLSGLLQRDSRQSRSVVRHDNYSPIPFLCVEGSSGMGKTQVAFALAGNRPWFYWPVASVGSTSNSPLLNANFASISSAFDKVTRMDDPMSKADYNILGACSNVYRNKLWAYGFIRALLQYCCSVDTRTGVMLPFEEELSAYVDKCNLKTVQNIRDQMKADGKLLPFFVLEEGSTRGGSTRACIDEDLLLYLSVLGGKTYPAYYDGNMTRSVFQVFLTHVQQPPPSFPFDFKTTPGKKAKLLLPSKIRTWIW